MGTFFRILGVAIVSALAVLAVEAAFEWTAICSATPLCKAILF